MNLARSFIRPTALCAVLFLFATLSTAQERDPKLDAAPLNPRYLEYFSHLQQGNLPSSIELQPAGYIPPSVDLSYLNTIRFSLKDAVGDAPLPARYDLRELGRVSPIRNQGNCGSCWTFATMGSLESTLMPGESRQFSENNLKDTQGRDYTPCKGGNGLQSTAYLARWSGPVNESDDPYSATDTNTSPAHTVPAKHVQDVLLMAGRQNATDNDNLKRAVMAYGATFILIYMGDENYNATNHTYNYMPSGSDPLKTHNHAVDVVGWDDNFDRNLFSNPPPANGAFIVRNSYGTKWGDSGYFYLSYYDAQAAHASIFSFYGVEPTSNWSRVYQYDEQGWISQVGYGSSDTAWFANVFTAQDTESIGAVSFYATVPNVAYTVNVYTGVKDVPTSGTLAGTTTGTLATAGYHTVRLANPVGVTSGTRFAVAVKIQAPGHEHPIAVQKAVAGEYSNITSHPGESYTSSDGSKWSDLTSGFDPTANVCLKAFTEKAGSGNVSVTIASNPPGQTITVDGTAYSSAKVFNWAMGSSHTVATDSVQGGSATRYVFSSWSDGGAQAHTLQVNQAGLYTANFATQYLLTTTTSPAAGGSIAASPNAADHFYNSGTSVQLTARAASGYVFDSWSAGLSGSVNPATIMVSQPLTVSGVFRSATATTITTNPPGLNIVVDGTTYTAPHNFTWTAAGAHTINAPSPQGTGTRYVFASWSDQGTQSHPVTASAGGGTYTATFHAQYLLTVQTTPAAGGTVSATPASSDGYYDAGTAVSLRAVARTGYTFSQWTGALLGSTNPQPMTMSGPRTVTAAFGGVSAHLANDESTGATAIGSLPFTGSEDTSGATANSKDPSHSCTDAQDSRSVWFKYVSNFTGVANISTINSDYDTVLAVYSADGSSELACNDDENELTVTSAVSIGITRGQTILIEVSAFGSNGIGGSLALSVTGQTLPTATNDERSTAARITSLPSNVSEITKAATTNSTDPTHSCTGGQDGKSVWFRYVAAYTGRLRVNTIGSDYDTVLAGYSAGGNELACSDDIDDSTTASEIEFPVNAGTTYYIEAASWNDSAGGLLVLNSMSEDVPPDNDTIDYALGIRTLPYTIQEDTVAATEDDSDPWHTCSGDWDLRTLWFYYTASSSGTVRINTFGSDYDTVLSIYDGDSGDEILCNDDASDDTFQSAADLVVTAGKSYWIEVSEYNDEYATGGTLFLNLVSAAGGDPSAASGSQATGVVDQFKLVRAGSDRPARHCCTRGGNAAPRVDVKRLHRREAPTNLLLEPRSEP